MNFTIKLLIILLNIISFVIANNALNSTAKERPYSEYENIEPHNMTSILTETQSTAEKLALARVSFLFY